ncbi:MAG: endolytic transglycosylase MltG [Pseudomonadota bacterium]
MRIGLFLIVLALLGAAAFEGLRQGVYEAEGPLRDAAIVEVPVGASVARIAERLEERGVISSAMAFETAARLRGDAGRIKAGDYEIEAAASLRAVLDALVEGRAVEHRITIAEGLTTAEALALVEASPVLTGEITEKPREGALAPDTYFVRRGETRQAVVERMAAAQARILAEAWAGREEGLPITSPVEALILASIIEKETGVPSERREVASVFINRLRKGMRLETDPTVIYGITRGAGPLGRRLTRADVRAPTDYNTYTISGLPPTPIANPGRASIEAALDPAETDYLFFVADGTGGHAFAKTYDGHRRNVAVWRRIRAAQDQAAAEAEAGGG